MIGGRATWSSLVIVAILAPGCIDPGPAGPVHATADGLEATFEPQGSRLYVNVTNVGEPRAYRVGCGNDWLTATLVDRDGEERFVHPSRHHCLGIPPPQTFGSGDSLAAVLDWTESRPDHEPAPLDGKYTWRVRLWGLEADVPAG